jgi:hypothetical protein
MKSVLMDRELGGGLGHLMHLRPLAAALVEAGYEVVLLARHQSAEEVFPDLANSDPGLTIGPAPVVKRKRDARPDPATTHTLADLLAAQRFDDPKAPLAAAERWQLKLDRIRPALVAASALNAASSCVAASGRIWRSSCSTERLLRRARSLRRRTVSSSRLRTMTCAMASLGCLASASIASPSEYAHAQSRKDRDQLRP